MDPDSIAATIYQAFTLRLAREVARAAIGDRDLAERWLDRADNGFIAHVTSPWRWQAHLLELWDEGDAELIGRPVGRAGARCAARRARRPRRPLRRRPGGVALGPVHALEFPHALGAANPLLGADLQPHGCEVGGGQETVAQVGWDPRRPVQGDLGARAGGWSPTRPIPTARAGSRSPASRATPASPHYDDLQPRWRGRR